MASVHPNTTLSQVFPKGIRHDGLEAASDYGVRRCSDFKRVCKCSPNEPSIDEGDRVASVCKSQPNRSVFRTIWHHQAYDIAGADPQHLCPPRVIIAASHKHGISDGS